MKKKLFILTALLVVGISVVAAQNEIRILGFDQGYLGVHIRDVSAEDVQNLSLPAEAGVVVERVQEGSPAAEAGLSEGDVIVDFSTFPVLSVRQLQRLVSETPPGREVELGLLRGGQKLSRTITIAERKRGRVSRHLQGRGMDIPIPDFDLDALPFVWNRDHSVFLHSDRPQLGIRGEAVTEQLAETLGVEEKEGVLIMEVLKNTPAERAGLKAGDVIITVDDQPVSNLRDLRRRLKPGSFKLQVVRNKQKQSFTVELESQEDEEEAHGHESIRL